jgi:hypothetical protein
MTDHYFLYLGYHSTKGRRNQDTQRESMTIMSLMTPLNLMFSKDVTTALLNKLYTVE